MKVYLGWQRIEERGRERELYGCRWGKELRKKRCEKKKGGDKAHFAFQSTHPHGVRH